jgi:hypothetical protein
MVGFVPVAADLCNPRGKQADPRFPDTGAACPSLPLRGGLSLAVPGPLLFAPCNRLRPFRARSLSDRLRAIAQTAKNRGAPYDLLYTGTKRRRGYRHLRYSRPDRHRQVSHGS